MEGYSHRMDRRSNCHHYSWPGVYHLTIKVNGTLYQPLGRVVGDSNEADGKPNAPRVELSETGRMVEYELTTSISRHYPMVEVQDYVVMPEHLHAIVVVKRRIVTANGREAHLGQVIAGFKKGCNRRFWEIEERRGKPAATRTAMPAGASSPMPGVAVSSSASSPGVAAAGAASSPGAAAAGAASSRGVAAAGAASSPGAAAAGAASSRGAGVCPAVYPQGYKVPSQASTGRQPLFAYGYVDVMPVDEKQLDTQRQYIRNNPRSRLMRTQNRAWLQPQRRAIPTALSLSALKGYLLRECRPSQTVAQAWNGIQPRLLAEDGLVVCDSYGNRELLACRLLPVVCHRKDIPLFERQRQCCLREAECGAVLVSARIAKGEQAIMDEAVSLRYPVVLVVDNGFPEVYHPSERRVQLCADNRLLLVSPWRYRYQPVGASIGAVECKTMNGVVQSLCRMKDSWWKDCL